MIHRNWRDPEAYAFCDALTSAQWAWEFLRRNPEYQRQWQEFWHTWQALEDAYGRPPDRDFCAWKNDPRAWVPASECEGSDCRIDQDKVLIECALGARWGFHKFPPDPRDDDPVGEGRLSWRDRGERPLPVIDAESTVPEGRPETMALAFDLSLPLKPQLEQARRQLQMEAGLRLLDAETAGELQEMAENVKGSRILWDEAQGMMEGGYLELLRIPP